VFTTAVCTHCARAKAALTAAAIRYVEIDVGEDVELLTRLKAFTGRGTVPQVRAKLFATAQLKTGVEDQGAEEASWRRETIITPVLQSVCRASQRLSFHRRGALGVRRPRNTLAGVVRA
jgi:hypothetical protein